MSPEREAAKKRINSVVEKWKPLFLDNLRPKLDKQYNAGADYFKAGTSDTLVTGDSKLGSEMYEAASHEASAMRSGLDALERALTEEISKMYRDSDVTVSIDLEKDSSSYPVTCDVAVTVKNLPY